MNQNYTGTVNHVGIIATTLLLVVVVTFCIMQNKTRTVQRHGVASSRPSPEESAAALNAYKLFLTYYYDKKYPQAMSALDDLLRFNMNTIDYPLAVVLSGVPQCTVGAKHPLPCEIVTKIRTMTYLSDNKEMSFTILNKLLAAQQKAFPVDDLRTAGTYKYFALLYAKYNQEKDSQKNYDEAMRIESLYESEVTVLSSSKGSYEDQLEAAISKYEQRSANHPYAKSTIYLLDDLITKASRAKRGDLITKYGLERLKIDDRLELSTQELRLAWYGEFALYATHAESSTDTRFWLDKLERESNGNQPTRQLITLAELEYHAGDKEKAKRALRRAETAFDRVNDYRLDERIRQLNNKLK